LVVVVVMMMMMMVVVVICLFRKALNPPYVGVGGPQKANKIDVPTAALAVSTIRVDGCHLS